jgi:hypothetical protein
MFDPNVSRHPKPNPVARPISTPVRVAPMSDRVSLHDQIQERAHRLYESRGCENGKEEQDWLIAEQEILNEHHSRGNDHLQAVLAI